MISTRRPTIRDSGLRQEGESFCELAIRPKDLSKKWTKDCSTLEDIGETVVIEQVINTLLEIIHVWIKERNPTAGLEAGQLADDYLQARGTIRDSIIKSQGKVPLSKTPVLARVSSSK